MDAPFITFEGLEGVGKTTQIANARRFLEARGHSVVLTREPGGTALGETLRAVLLDPQNTGICADAELLMMFAARAQHVHEIIAPALARGQWVLCDRFTDATYAYQGGGRGIDPERIARIEEFTHADLTPGLTVLLDAPVSVGLLRANQRGDGADRFEREAVAFFEAVRAAYLARARDEPGRFVVVDAERGEAAVRQDVEAALGGLDGAR